MNISIDKINEIIDEEMKYAKEVNPVMALGMDQVKMLLNDYANELINRGE